VDDVNRADRPTEGRASAAVVHRQMTALLDLDYISPVAP